MPINTDLMKLGEEYDFSPQAVIGSDFYTGNDVTDIPDEHYEASDDEQPDFSNWKTVVNRLFMAGKLSGEILKAIGEKIAVCRQKQEILDYLDKYNGLVGTVFLDSEVIAGGMPLSLIPKQFKPYHMFAINCKKTRRENSRNVQGGIGGDIDNFLNSVDEIHEDLGREICVYTGLPVLKKGMFTPAVIESIMTKLGEQGNTLKELQQALLKHVYGVGIESPHVSADAPSPDYSKYRLQRPQMDVDVPDAQELFDIPFESLKEQPLKVAVQNAEKTMSVKAGYVPTSQNDVCFNEESPFFDLPFDELAETPLVISIDVPVDNEGMTLNMEYKKDEGNDITFEDIPDEMTDIKVDGGLRF